MEGFLGGVDGAAGARGKGDDLLWAQQELRVEGSAARSYWAYGRVCFDAGTALCDGFLDEGTQDSVSGRARGGGWGGDQHGIFGGALGRRVADRAWASSCEGYDHGRRDVRRGHPAHAAVPVAASEPGALRGVRGGWLRASGDLVHPLPLLQDEFSRLRYTGSGWWNTSVSGRDPDW
jgi:hypothetical protein